MTSNRIFVGLLGISLILGGCGDTLDFRNAEISNGKMFSKGANSPFSGNVTNIPMPKLPIGKIGQIFQTISSATKDDVYAKVIMANGISGLLANGQSGILCDLPFSKGIPDGELKCKIAQGEISLLKASYKNGALNGDLIVFDLNKKDSVVAQFPYENGEPNGQSTIKSPRTGKVVHHVSWVKGILNGKEEIYDENNGQLVFKGVISNGKYNGESERYSSDGALIEKTQWEHGYVKNSSKPTQSSADPMKCVDQWIAAYRKEKGEEAMIRTEQLDEWESWCKEGKQAPL